MSHHLIQKLSLDVSFSQNVAPGGLQNEVAEFLHMELLPGIEELFNSFGDNITLRIDTLTIDIDHISGNDWQRTLRQKLLASVQEELKAELSRTPVRTSDKATLPRSARTANLHEQARYFFKRGLLPWFVAGNASSGWITRWESELLEHPEEFILTYGPVFAGDTNALIRFVYSVSDAFHQKLIAFLRSEVWSGIIFKYIALTGDKIQTLRNFYLRQLNEPQQSGNRNSSVASRLVIEAMETLKQAFDVPEEEIVEILDTLIQSDVSVSSEAVDIDTEQIPENTVTVVSVEDQQAEIPGELYVTNAGLVLLHPFLSVLFSHTKLTEDNVWLSKESQMTGVLLTKYLVYGSCNSEEHELVLNKVLCGMVISEPVNVQLQLPQSLKDEADNMLQQAIAHWNAPGSLSLTSLRESFLQREGKLTLEPEAMHLKVDRKGWDVLLSTLPWSFSIVKGAVMKTIVYVEW